MHTRHVDSKLGISVDAFIPENISEIMHLACNVCKRDDFWFFDSAKLEDAERWKLIHKVLNSGHWSIAEHISLTFHITGISRACANQLVRHRLCSFSQLSQRYTVLGDRIDAMKVSDWLDASMTNFEGEKARLHELLSPFFQLDGLNPDKLSALAFIFTDYHNSLEAGTKPENARALLPMCARTNLVMTCNLREFIYICNLRLCGRAQKEIRALIRLCADAIEVEHLKRYFVPKCERDGRCTESEPCGSGITAISKKKE